MACEGNDVEKCIPEVAILLRRHIQSPNLIKRKVQSTFATPAVPVVDLYSAEAPPGANITKSGQRPKRCKGE